MNHLSPSVGSHPAPPDPAPAPATFRSKYRWLNLLLGLIVCAISISGLLRGYPFHAINLLTSSLLIGQALLWRRLGFAVLGALALQLTLGLSIVHLQLPLLLAAAHNLGAEALLATLVLTNFFAWRAARGHDA